MPAGATRRTHAPGRADADPTAPEHSIWLLAREDQQAALRQRVRELAPRHAGHVFEPHVTLQGDMPLPRARAVALVEALARSTPPLHWTVQAVEGTEHYFRALYLRLDAGTAFDRLCRLCAEASASDDGLSPYAHLSLAYGATQGAAAALRHELSQALAGQTLVLDRVALARSSKVVPIGQWQVLHAAALTGP